MDKEKSLLKRLRKSNRVPVAPGGQGLASCHPS